MTVRASNFKLPPKKAYSRAASVLNGQLHDVEHWRFFLHDFTASPVHAAIAVDVDGRFYVGTAVTSLRDQYNRGRGHAIAVGRALKRAINGPASGELPLPLPRQKELRLALEDTARLAAIEAEAARP